MNSKSLSKYKLQQMGFDKIDSRQDITTFLKSISIPSGPSKIKEAYAYGMGLILDFNNTYCENIQDVHHDQFMNPEYLHLVIASDINESDKDIS